MMDKVHTALGIIEGFYGKPYKEDTRLSLIRYAKDFGYSFYIYAPKNDENLRKKFYGDLNPDFLKFQKNLGDFCKNISINYGFGISPLNIFSKDKSLIDKTIEKAVTISQVSCAKIVALLFDDIKIRDNEAILQNDLIQRLDKALPLSVEHILVCPTYYSEDPILEKIFGIKPQNYFNDLTANLSSRIKFFYTGNKVISSSINETDLLLAKKNLGENIAIWDNYPVNDGKRLSSKIFTKPFAGRNNLNGLCKLHAVNPMTEGILSTLSLVSLPLIYKGALESEIKKEQDKLLKELFNKEAPFISKYLEILHLEGKEALDYDTYVAICKSCRRANSKASFELLDFLNDFYAFDPQCLT